MSDDIERIRRALTRTAPPTSDFDLNPELILPEHRKLRPAAVLVALQATDQGTQVMLTKRASSLKHHPGQIAFAGGKVDGQDENIAGAALREAWEEVGLARDNVQVLGQLPSHETVTGFSVTPVVARIREPFEPTLQQAEVAEVFFVPWAHLTDLARYQVQSRRWRGVERYYQTVPYGPYYIWGATARILYALAERLAV